MCYGEHNGLFFAPKLAIWLHHKYFYFNSNIKVSRIRLFEFKISRVLQKCTSCFCLKEYEMIDRILKVPFESEIYLQNFDMPKWRVATLQHPGLDAYSL